VWKKVKPSLLFLRTAFLKFSGKATINTGKSNFSSTYIEIGSNVPIIDRTLALANDSLDSNINDRDLDQDAKHFWSLFYNHNLNLYLFFLTFVFIKNQSGSFHEQELYV